MPALVIPLFNIRANFSRASAVLPVFIEERAGPIPLRGSSRSFRCIRPILFWHCSH